MRGPVVCLRADSGGQAQRPVILWPISAMHASFPNVLHCELCCCALTMNMVNIIQQHGLRK